MNIKEKTLLITAGLYIYISRIIRFLDLAFGDPIITKLIDHNLEQGLIRALPVFLLYFPIKYFLKKSFWKTLLGIFIIFVLPIVYLAIEIYT